jgi:hypothetical protein
MEKGYFYPMTFGKLLWKTLLIGVLVFLPKSGFTQQHYEPLTGELYIAVGDTLVIGKPKSEKVFAFIDIFKKTRWDPRPLPEDAFTQKFGTYDSSTGNGFYRYFFRGDFDAAELPAHFEGRRFPILGIEVVTKEKNQTPLNVVYLKTDQEHVVIMVEIDNATQYDEIEGVIYAPRP